VGRGLYSLLFKISIRSKGGGGEEKRRRKKKRREGGATVDRRRREPRINQICIHHNRSSTI